MGKIRIRPVAVAGSGGLRQHAASHAMPILLVGVATVVGALAALAFQVLSARALGPRDFGLLAAFLAILNVAAIGSSALQNSVAVKTAEVGRPDVAAPMSARRGPSEATILGLAAAVLVAAFSPALVRSLNATFMVVLLSAAAIPLSFWLAEAVGVMQGVGRSLGAVWWTTLSLLARVALVLLSVVLGLGIGGVLVAVLLGTAVATVGASVPARHIPHPRVAVFTRSGLTVLLLSLTFAWLANADVIVLRAGASEVVAGTYASAAILVKASFLLPSTLSLYLLPRFVRNRGNRELTRMGESVTVGVTAVAGVALALTFWLIGDVVVRIVYGASFSDGADLLLPLALVYLPWTIAQSVLIRLTAEASRMAALTVVVVAVVQLLGFLLAVPDVAAVLWVQAALGVAVLAIFLLLVRRLNRPPIVTPDEERA